MAVYSWTRVFGLPLGEIIDLRAKRQFEALAHDCIETISDFFQEGQDEKTLADFLARVPLRRIAQPDEVAPLAVFLASSAAAYCTGGVYSVDGGQS